MKALKNKLDGLVSQFGDGHADTLLKKKPEIWVAATQEDVALSNAARKSGIPQNMAKKSDAKTIVSPKTTKSTPAPKTTKTTTKDAGCKTCGKSK